MIEVFRSAGAGGAEERAAGVSDAADNGKTESGANKNSMSDMMNLSFTKEQRLEMNAKLNKIKK